MSTSPLYTAPTESRIRMLHALRTLVLGCLATFLLLSRSDAAAGDAAAELPPPSKLSVV